MAQSKGGPAALLAVGMLVMLLVAVVTSGAYDAECSLRPTTLPRFKYLTHFGWHDSSPAARSVATVAKSAALSEIAQWFGETGRGGILEVQAIFFSPATAPGRGLVVNPNAQHAWMAMQTGMAALVKTGAIVGVYVGDEVSGTLQRLPSLRDLSLVGPCSACPRSGTCR